MSLLSRLIVSCLSLGILMPSAYPALPEPGEYVTEGAWGTLSIEDNRFEIYTTGRNLHVCELNGRVKGDQGYATAPADNEPDGKPTGCVIRFTPTADGIKVTNESGDVCLETCGMWTGFEGEYLRPPKDCSYTGRKTANDEFRKKYDTGDYRRSYEILHKSYQQCSRFMDWIEIDRVRNDLAITQYHLGDKAACLSLLNETRAANYQNEQELQSGLPPGDFGAYLPVAESTWSNEKQCSQD